MRNKNYLEKLTVFIENDTILKERRNKDIVWQKARKL